MLDEKTLEKTFKELIELHKRVIKTYLLGIDISHSNIKKFFLVYDHYISPDNIIHYFHRPVRIFVRALILKQLHKISDYNLVHPIKKRKRRKNNENS